MTSPTQLSIVQSIYDARASKYDSAEDFHPTQAADYLRWMNITPGLKILDLACGTGAITIPAARGVGPSGKVVGVDISGDSLTIARLKAERENLNIKFIRHDIAALHEVKELEGDFDLITCASAFVLLQDSVAVMKGWARLLKSEGRVIFDVPASGSMIVGYVLNIVGNKLKIPLPFNQTTFRSLEAVKQLLAEAGFDASGCFTTKSYGDTVLVVENADEMFEGIISRKEWFGGAYASFNDPTVKEVAKEMFSVEMKKLADEDGKIKEQLRFNMAVGIKV
jgi:ubiquinone/menaquinone biosynthesis C-methylase UbiE